MIQTIAAQAVSQLGRIVLGPVVHSLLKRAKVPVQQRGSHKEKQHPEGFLSMQEYMSKHSSSPSSEHVREL